jgi:hypothetical protein
LALVTNPLVVIIAPGTSVVNTGFYTCGGASGTPNPVYPPVDSS